MSKQQETLLTMKGISKSFSGVVALNNAEIDLKTGEVVALMGENGAGKSTLMKILTGIYSRDSGTVTYMGREVEYKGPSESEEDGIAIVHQELNMMNDLTVAQNLFIGKESMNGFFIDDAEMNRKANELFKILNIDINPAEKIENLTVGKQQMVEIAKAISKNAKVIIFDEPTAALTDAEIEELFKVINDLRDKGTGMIYISHRMDEINVISDRVTVMRDGEFVGTLVTKECDKNDIIKLMVGRTIFAEPKAQSNVDPDAPVILKCENLNRGKYVKDVSFELRKGEILSFAGLMGAGRTEVARLIFGADRKDSGKVYINGKEVQIDSPKDAVAAGIGYLSEDRKRYGLIVDKPVEENTVIANLDSFMKGLFIDTEKSREVSKKYVNELKTKTPSVEQPVKKLSGGNQQKVVIAKWLVRDCDILIFDEPTRGIDIGAKSEIYHLMEELAQQGKSIIMVSSELPEVLRMSDRVIVMCEGKVTGTFDISEATQERIMQAATNR
ncbi:sugar ABC transporter ATP-binding protein [Pasteurella skyensis]|uniref:sugar ABC transporter ATP-binding protein n=1 Tax=Phocoenobacter skyensis TaxID=97481 RepID=UPI00277747A5|nr:sugar ABC transporter ATP-binding protein [Pasteurella skyensis]MDP8177388.1 sugar ABC transporter ATP-binding protein [Pasteurella skyensis]MDP8199984.1 sugar ABC transporter ATP-binding protein [Pasteurella skyensis]